MTQVTQTTARRKSGIKKIELDIASARRCFIASKDSAIEAAAYAYFVWRETEASSYGANWLNAEIEKRNAEIDHHNKAERDDRQRAEKFVLGRLKDEHLDQAEKERLRELAALDDEVWKLRLMVSIEPRQDANRFTGIVRFVFGFNSPAHASNTSRYATVLEWIDAHCAAVEDTPEIVRAIKDAGRFDRVVYLQRLARKGPETSDTHKKPEGGDQVDSESDGDLPEVPNKRKAWQSAPPLATFELPIEGQSNGLVLFLGRYTDGKIDVVSPVPLAADKLDSMIERLGMPTVPEADRLPDPVERIAA